MVKYFKTQIEFLLYFQCNITLRKYMHNLANKTEVASRSDIQHA